MSPPDSAPKSGSTAKPPPLKVNVLKCRAEGCGGLLAFEQTDRGYLLGQVLELADVDGDKRYFPCPKCGGRQLVEEYEHSGQIRVRVCGFEPA